MSTKTIDELTRQWLGDTLYDAIGRVEIEETNIPVEPDVMDFDELARQYLSDDTERAISHVDLQQERLGFRVEAGKFRLEVGGRGMWLILAALTIMVLLIGVEPAMEIIRTFFNLVVGELKPV